MLQKLQQHVKQVPVTFRSDGLPSSFASIPQPDWLEFVDSPEDAAILAAEAARAQLRTERHKRRQAERGEIDADEQTEIEEVEADGREGRNNNGQAATSIKKDVSSSHDDDIILLSQAPKARVLEADEQGIPRSKRARGAGGLEAGSGLSSASSSRGSSPHRVKACHDSVAEAAERLAASLCVDWDQFPTFDEPPEEGEEGMALATAAEDDMTWAQSSQQSHPSAATAIAAGKSLEEAFVEASQRVRAAASSQDLQQADNGQEKRPTRASERAPSTSPSPPPAVFSSLLEQLDLLREALLSKPVVASQLAQHAVLTHLLTLKAEADGRAHMAAMPPSLTPALILDTLRSDPRLASTAELKLVFDRAARWRQATLSAAEFEAAVARMKMQLLPAEAHLLFFAAFLDASISHARVRSLLSQSVLPLLRSVGSTSTTRILLALLMRGHEDALTQSVLCPLLLDVLSLPSADGAAASPHPAAALPLMVTLVNGPILTSHELGAASAVTKAAAAASNSLTAASRQMLLQHLCMHSLQQFERNRTAQGGATPSFQWSDPALQMMHGFLTLSSLPPPSAELHATLSTLAASTEMSGTASAIVSGILSLLYHAGDVSSLLLACLFLSPLSPSVRQSPNAVRPLLTYLDTYSKLHSIATTPALRQLLQTAAKHVGGPIARRIKQILS